MSIRNLEHLFRPASVAVIGATDREHSIGSLVMRNLREVTEEDAARIYEAAL